MHGTVVRESEAPIAERVRIEIVDGQPRRRPPEVDQAEVAERLPGKLLELRLVGPQRRLADNGLIVHRAAGGLIPGHSPAVGVQFGQRNQRLESLLTDQVGNGGFFARAITKQSAHRIPASLNRACSYRNFPIPPATSMDAPVM